MKVFKIVEKLTSKKKKAFHSAGRTGELIQHYKISGYRSGRGSAFELGGIESKSGVHNPLRSLVLSARTQVEGFFRYFTAKLALEKQIKKQLLLANRRKHIKLIKAALLQA